MTQRQTTGPTDWAEQLQNSLTTPVLLQKQSVTTSASIGIALTQANHWHSPQNLLRDARTAMYRTNALGQAHHEVFASGMLQESVERFTLENDLRQGLEAKEFTLYYQPLICLHTENITGFEALVRWQHPQRGFVSPGNFIPLAEETGLIIPLGHWIVTTYLLVRSTSTKQRSGVLNQFAHCCKYLTLQFSTGIKAT